MKVLTFDLILLLAIGGVTRALVTTPNSAKAMSRHFVRSNGQLSVMNNSPAESMKRALHMTATSVEKYDVAEATINGSNTIKLLDKEINKHDRLRVDLLDKLTKAESIVSSLKKRKQEYLEGVELGKLSEDDKFTETALRSIVKAMCWRVIAGSVTLITALRFSGSMSTALSIVGSDFFSKAFTMFIGERLMNKSNAGRKSGADDVGRSLAKALIWRLFAICNTLTMSLLIAKDIKVASKIAGSDAIFKTGLMFVYERVWAKISWGKEYVVEYAI